jgi:hypothetical protein
MKAFTWQTFAPVLNEAGRPDRGSFPIVPCPFTKTLCQRNTSARDAKSLPKVL